MRKLLEVENLSTYFITENGIIKAVDGVSLTVDRGETLGIVGESGCGKTVCALSIMRLVPSPPGKIVGGNIFLNGRDLLKLTKEEMRQIRGKDISMIFQEPMTSLNPVLTIGDQVSEVLRAHEEVSTRESLNRAIEMLGKVGMPTPENIVDCYPHQLSGGMRQRVMIAMAMICHPKLLLADEPTTALDVTVQAQIIDLMNTLKEDTRTAVILITHDLGVIGEAAQTVAVMYAGKVVEFCDVKTLFSNPLHPYTSALLESVPGFDRGDSSGYLKVIPGSVPLLYNLPPGCSFQDRCSFVFPLCRTEEPPSIEGETGHQVRCWLYR